MIKNETKKVIIGDQTRSGSRYTTANMIDTSVDWINLSKYSSVNNNFIQDLPTKSIPEIISACSELHPTFAEIVVDLDSSLSEYECIMVIRNPISRYVSGWKKLQERKETAGISFDQILITEFNNKVLTNIEMPWHFDKKLSSWFLDENSNPLSVTILDFEDLVNEITGLITRLTYSIPSTINDIVNNSPDFPSTSTGYENWMTQSTYDLLTTYLADDITYYESLGFTMPTLLNP